MYLYSATFNKLLNFQLLNVSCSKPQFYYSHNSITRIIFSLCDMDFQL